MKIYMDVCCLNRPFDNQEQDRIRIESEAILAILSRCQEKVWTLASSDIIDLELSKTTNSERLEKVRALYSVADQSKRLSVTDTVKERAIVYQKNGVKLFDSLHLALAETHGQQVLLTTDDSFLGAAKKNNPVVVVSNPVTWLMEVLKYGEHTS